MMLHQFSRNNAKFPGSAISEQHNAGTENTPSSPDVLVRTTLGLSPRDASALEELEALMTTLSQRVESQFETPRIVATERGDLVFFDAREISRFFAAGKYVCFISEGKEYLVNESLKALEARLQPFAFFRVHRRELINLEHITRLSRTSDAGTVTLKDGQVAAVSRQMLSTVRDILLEQPTLEPAHAED